MSNILSTIDATYLRALGGIIGGMAYLREYCQAEKFSEQASKLLVVSWRHKSTRSYNSLFHKWEYWGAPRHRNPISSPIVVISNFLADLYQEGYSFSSLNLYRSAISSIYEHIDGIPVGQHPLVARILKEACNLCPPTPRYSNTWKVSTVVVWLGSIKTVLLLSLTRPLQSADLSNFFLSSLKYLPEDAMIMPACPSKQSRVGKSRKEFFFPAFESNSNLCPANALRVYVPAVLES